MAPGIPHPHIKTSVSRPDYGSYHIRIDRVVDYIQANLESDLKVKQLAKIACFSQFHFSRIFKARMGESVYRFIQRLRLEKAAEMLASNRGLPIIEVAMKCGFSTPSAFAKSFKGHFNLSPTQWRRQCDQMVSPDLRKEDDLSPRLSFVNTNPEWTIDLPQGRRCITIETIPPLKLAYIRYVGRYQGNADLFDSLYSNLFQWAVPRGVVKETNTRFNIYHDNPEITQSRNLRVMAAVPIPETVRNSDTVSITRLSGGRYAVCRCFLTQKDFLQAWEWMFRSWLIRSGYELDNREMFERYHNEQTNQGERIFEVDICIPVKPK